MVLLILFGFAGFIAICLGVTGFTKDGIAVSSKTKISGAPGMIVGIVCMLFGILLWLIVLHRMGVFERFGL